MNGGVGVFCPIRPPHTQGKNKSTDWKVDINELKSKITPKTKIIVCNSPHNPLGKW